MFYLDYPLSRAESCQFLLAQIQDQDMEFKMWNPKDFKPASQPRGNTKIVNLIDIAACEDAVTSVSVEPPVSLSDEADVLKQILNDAFEEMKIQAAIAQERAAKLEKRIVVLEEENAHLKRGKCVVEKTHSINIGKCRTITHVSETRSGPQHIVDKMRTKSQKNIMSDHMQFADLGNLKEVQQQNFAFASTPDDVAKFEGSLSLFGSIEVLAKSAKSEVLSESMKHSLQVPAAFHGLQSAELVALRHYTQHTYKLINPLLWKAAGNLASPCLKQKLPAIKLCATALTALPVYDGPLCRLEKKMEQRHADAVVGAVIEWHGFTSSGYNHAALQQSEFQGDVEWQICVGHSGRRIDFLSKYPAEGEVLFLPGTKMMVTERSGGARGQKLIVKVREV